MPLSAVLCHRKDEILRSYDWVREIYVLIDQRKLAKQPETISSVAVQKEVTTLSTRFLAQTADQRRTVFGPLLQRFARFV